MTTQRTPYALAREAVGLFFIALGLFGVLLALVAIHPGVAVTAMAVGCLIAGLFLRPNPDAPRGTIWARYLLCTAGCGGISGTALAFSPPLGWICVCVGLVLLGLHLATSERRDKGSS